MNISDLTKSLRRKVNDNGPEILMGIGIAGMFTSTMLAVKATPKVYEMIKKENELRERIDCETELTKKEIVQMSWKSYLPSAISFGVSAACLIGANSVKTKRNALLASAYTISERALLEYKDKVIEVVGDEKEREIRDAVSRDRIKKDPVDEGAIIFTGSGDVLCYEPVSGRYFKSDVNKIRKAENEMNHYIIQDMSYSFNMWCSDLGLPSNKVGNDIGWNVDDGMVELYFSSQLTDDQEPCLVINYSVDPHVGYGKIF